MLIQAGQKELALFSVAIEAEIRFNSISNEDTKLYLSNLAIWSDQWHICTTTFYNI